MDTPTRSLRKRKSANQENNKSNQENNKSQFDFDEAENIPPKKKSVVNEQSLSNTEGSSITSQSDTDETIAIKSFYGKKEKKSFPHSPKRRRAVKKVLEKLSDEDNVSQEESQSCESEVEAERNQQAVRRSDQAVRTTRSKKDMKTVLSAVKKRDCPKTNSPKMSKVQAKAKSPQMSKIQAKTNSPQTSKIQAKTNSPQTSKIQAKTNSPQTAKVQAMADSPVTPRSGERRFFKHRPPGSAEKFIPGVVIRKGFDIKFTPSRKDIVLGKHKKVSEKGKGRKAPLPLTPFPKGKIQNFRTSGFLVKKNVRHSYPLGVSQKFSYQKPGSPELQEEILKRESDESSSPNSGLSVTASIHSGPSVRVRSESQSTEAAHRSLVSASDVDTNSSVSTEDKVSLITEDTSSGEDTSSDMMEGIQPLEEIEVSREGTSKKENQEKDEDAPQRNSESDDSTESPLQKYFPIFNKTTPSPSSRLRSLRDSKTRSSRRSHNLKFIEDKDDQMTLDAGQKKFGATQCDTCGMVYSHAEPTDETTHAKFHQSIINALKFPGWKKERVVREFDDGGRVIMVTHDDPKYAIKKVEEINKIMGNELGFPDMSFIFRTDYKVFLMISDDKKVIGCCIAENITQGYPVLADSQSSQDSGSRPWYCDLEPKPASVGISKIWVHKLNRKNKVASKLLDCVRQHFHYGMYIAKKRMAFSDPTPDGKSFATKYVGTSSFLVYKFG